MHATSSKIRDTIYSNIRRQIISGELHRGQRLVETQIAAQYDVNKAHVRDVLQTLQGDMLVEYVPMKGFFVLGISKEDLQEFAKIREMLESAIYEEFLENAEEEDIEIVKRYTKRKIALIQAGMQEESLPETRATYEHIYGRSPYRHMVSIMRIYQEYVDLMIELAVDGPEDRAKTIKNSTLLYQVFDTRDCELAKRWIHIRYENAVRKIQTSSIYYSRDISTQ